MRYYRYVPWSELRRMYRRRRALKEEAKQLAFLMVMTIVVIRMLL